MVRIEYAVPDQCLDCPEVDRIAEDAGCGDSCVEVRGNLQMFEGTTDLGALCEGEIQPCAGLQQSIPVHLVSRQSIAHLPPARLR